MNLRLIKLSLLPSCRLVTVAHCFFSLAVWNHRRMSLSLLYQSSVLNVLNIPSPLVTDGTGPAEAWSCSTNLWSAFAFEARYSTSIDLLYPNSWPPAVGYGVLGPDSMSCFWFSETSLPHGIFVERSSPCKRDGIRVFRCFDTTLINDDNGPMRFMVLQRMVSCASTVWTYSLRRSMDVVRCYSDIL
jgi:hypothetical protein